MNYSSIIKLLTANRSLRGSRECWGADMYIRVTEEGNILFSRTSKFNGSIMHTVTKYIPSHSDITHTDWKTI